MIIHPFSNQILVKPIPKKQRLIADQGTLCEYGDVMAVGPEVKGIKVGDVIGFNVWGIKTLEIDNEKYRFIQEDSPFILAKLEL